MESTRKIFFGVLAAALAFGPAAAAQAVVRAAPTAADWAALAKRPDFNGVWETGGGGGGRGGGGRGAAPAGAAPANAPGAAAPAARGGAPAGRGGRGGGQGGGPSLTPAYAA